VTLGGVIFLAIGLRFPAAFQAEPAAA
jgi:hypothetical protein